MGTTHRAGQSKILKEKHFSNELLAELAVFCWFFFFFSFTGKNIKPAVVIHTGVFWETLSQKEKNKWTKPVIVRKQLSVLAANDKNQSSQAKIRILENV